MDGEDGADGCIDFHDADNAGLAECIYQGEFGVSMRDAYKQWCTTVSLADFFVIAAEALMEQTRGRVQPKLEAVLWRLPPALSAGPELCLEPTKER